MCLEQHARVAESEPTPLRAANRCIVGFKGPQPQVCQDSRDELILKNTSSRDKSNTLVAPPTAENEIAYSTHYCSVPSFESRAIKQVEVRRTVAPAVNVLAAKLLSCTTATPVHDSCATPQVTDVI